MNRRQLGAQQPGDALAVPSGLAESDLRPLGVLEIELQIVLPGKADTAVQLDAGAGDPAVGVRGVILAIDAASGAPASPSSIVQAA